MSRRPGLQHQPGHRGADRVLRAVRASRASVLRPRVHRLHRPRGDHRHLQADPSRARLRQALHRSGARRRGDRRRARAHPQPARRRRASERDAPVHADAGRAREPLAHVDVLLARQLRAGPAAAGGVPGHCELAVGPLIDPFDVLYEADLPRYRLPDELAHLYGSLGFAGRVVYSNFVESLDGVVTLGSKPSAGSEISGRNQADRFLMALLRACADAVLLGAGTLRATPGHQWTAEHVFPDLASQFGELRSLLGRKPRPRLVLLTASGNVPISHPAVIAGASIVTTAEGAAALK